MDIQLFQHHLFKRIFFPFEIHGLDSLVKKFDHIYENLFLGSLFYSRICRSVFMPVQHYFHNCMFIISFEISMCETSNLILFFQRLSWAIQNPWRFYMNFRWILIYLFKKLLLLFWVIVAAHEISLVAVHRTSYCGGFFYCRVLTLGTWALV